MTPEARDWLGLLRVHTDRFAAVISDVDVDVAVTHCPGWSLHDLVVHLGGIHQWTAHAAVHADPDFEPAPVECGRPELADW